MKCLTKECDRRAYSRGMCRSCYALASRAVRLGDISWPSLVEKGLALEAREISSLTRAIYANEEPITPIEMEVKFTSPTSFPMLRMQLINSGWIPLGSEKHRNHYFISPKGSVRTRSVRRTMRANRTYLVIKDAVHGTKRKEFEMEVMSDIDILDKALLSMGLTLESKWSRGRETFANPAVGIKIMLDKNDGYGDIVEVEKILKKGENTEEALAQIHQVAASFKFEELPRARLEKMYAYYLANWKDYYLQFGKTFDPLQLT